MFGARVLFAGVTVIDCSAAAAVVPADPELLAELESIVGEFTVAVFVIVAPVGAVGFSCSTRATLTVPPLGIEPREQRTVPVPEHEPDDGVTDWNATSAGRTSLSPTLSAVPGPFLVLQSRTGCLSRPWSTRE